MSEPHASILTKIQPSNSETLPYWLVNVPSTEWPAECPDFLRDANEKDRGILATRNEDFVRMGWNDIRRVVGEW